MFPSSLRRPRSTGVLASVALAGAILSAAVAAFGEPPGSADSAGASVLAAPPLEISAVWDRAPSAKRLAETVEAVVAATVVDVRPGTPQRAKPTSQGYAPPPFPMTDVELRLERTLRGTELPSSFVLKAPGGAVEGQTYFVEGAPPYRRGERYVLFVRKNAGTSGYNAFEVDGRYRQRADGRFASAGENGLAGRLRGKSLAQLEEAVR